MSRLVGPLFEGNGVLLMPLVALGLFVFAVVAIGIRVYLMRSEQTEEYAALVFEDDEDFTKGNDE